MTAKKKPTKAKAEPTVDVRLCVTYKLPESKVDVMSVLATLPENVKISQLSVDIY